LPFAEARAINKKALEFSIGALKNRESAIHRIYVFVYSFRRIFTYDEIDRMKGGV
jgi:hypothetical protein